MKLRQNFVLFTVTQLFLLLIPQQQLRSQCTSPIAVFPYSESFELSNGNWQPSSSVHWQWGTIVPGTKAVISAAGGGQKCWIVGGLSGANYSSGNSYLQSPCFDFTALANPEITLKVFWETERAFDGVHLEYSTDQGVTWTLLGSASSNTNCTGVNWYNSASVRFLTNTAGWSGSIMGGASGGCQSGGGSGQWLTAKHTLNMLAGQSRVQFRFVFGAGTVCNDYEGFAIDDISIKEAAPPGAQFTYQCVGSNSITFTNNSSYCQSAILWNFGDPNSGANNTSTVDNPNHTFSSSGSYTITQTVNFSNGTTSSSSQVVNILGVNAFVLQPISCYGDQNGALSVTVTGGNGNYYYSWNTNPVQQTQTINQLSPGTYVVSVAAANACPSSSIVNLTAPNQIQITTNFSNATCNLNNGSIENTITGGTPPYNYNWTNGAQAATIQNLPPGSYQLTVTDNNGCTASTNDIAIMNVMYPISIFLGNDTVLCTGQSVRLNPGNFADYVWQDNSHAASFIANATGEYYVTVTNAQGCSASDTIQVLIDCKGVYFPSCFTPNGDGKNDRFGPAGDVGSLSQYQLRIYSRWGQIVFETQNPFEKWDGLFKSKILETGSYIWMASYKLNGEYTANKKGVITLVH